jgi:hypothetical protein
MYCEVPLRVRIVPRGSVDTVAELDVLVNVVLPRRRLPVVAYLSAFCELLTPLGIWCESGLVDVCRNVTADSWIAVFEPCAALDLLLEWVGKPRDHTHHIVIFLKNG